jgi:hypothetical protein
MQGILRGARAEEARQLTSEGAAKK